MHDYESLLHKTLSFGPSSPTPHPIILPDYEHILVVGKEADRRRLRSELVGLLSESSLKNNLIGLEIEGKGAKELEKDFRDILTVKMRNDAPFTVSIMIYWSPERYLTRGIKTLCALKSIYKEMAAREQRLPRTFLVSSRNYLEDIKQVVMAGIDEYLILKEKNIDRDSFWDKVIYTLKKRSEDGQRARVLIDSGLELEKKGFFDAAYKMFFQALGAYPNSARIMFLLGKLCQKRGDLERKSARKEDHNKKAEYYKMAEEWYRRAICDSDRSFASEALVALADLAEIKGELPARGETLKKLKDPNLKSAERLVSVGLIYLELERTAEAKEFFWEAWKQGADPFEMGAIFLSRDKKIATEFFRLSFTEKGDWLSLRHIFILLSLQKKWQAVMDLLEEQTEEMERFIADDKDVLAALVEAHARLGDEKAAFACLRDLHYLMESRLVDPNSIRSKAVRRLLLKEEKETLALLREMGLEPA